LGGAWWDECCLLTVDWNPFPFFTCFKYFLFLKKNMEKTYQIHIALQGSKPRIWRRMLVPSDLLLPDFHKIIQTVMGWENAHLHQFIKDRKFYMEFREEDDFRDDSTSMDYKDVKISDLLVSEKDKMNYEYDFGDGWIHELVLEKILPLNPKDNLPLCLDGKMNCPPEDCGGIPGFYSLLKILKNPKHKEYDFYLEWVGGEYDEEFFDKEEVNFFLKEKEYGCFDSFFEYGLN
jgi:hypothetical protein